MNITRTSKTRQGRFDTKGVKGTHKIGNLLIMYVAVNSWCLLFIMYVHVIWIQSSLEVTKHFVPKINSKTGFQTLECVENKENRDLRLISLVYKPHIG